MADIKTHLRELSVATTIGLLNLGKSFHVSDLYDSQKFLEYSKEVISSDISSATNLEKEQIFNDALKQIIDNGYQLGKAIFENEYFSIKKNDIITWQGNDTQKDDPVDITIGDYGFSLKEESFILENMGLYKLLNCYTGSNYKRNRHIFSDYARKEYEIWFNATWNELLSYLKENDGEWSYENIVKDKKSTIKLSEKNIKLEFFENEKHYSTKLPVNCKLINFEEKTCRETREEVFSKFINQYLKNNPNYNNTKKACAIAASEALVNELNTNLNYNEGLPRFLRIHEHEYYYAKTTASGIEIFKVPPRSSFGNDIIIESIKSDVPKTQANILTTIKNKKTGKTLILRNECRFSHGQFNGTPEAKLYYDEGSLEVIYERI